MAISGGERMRAQLGATHDIRGMYPLQIKHGLCIQENQADDRADIGNVGGGEDIDAGLKC